MSLNIIRYKAAVLRMKINLRIFYLCVIYTKKQFTFCSKRGDSRNPDHF